MSRPPDQLLLAAVVAVGPLVAIVDAAAAYPSGFFVNLYDSLSGP